MFDWGTTLVTWLAHLFNPPPLILLSQGQKIARSFLVAFTLFICCLAVATLGMIGLLLAGEARELVQDRASVAGMEIVFVGALVNALCFRAVLAIKKGEL